MSILPVDAPAAASASPVDYDDFVRGHAVRLRRLVLRRLGDLGDAEEIAQETLLRAHTHWPEFADEDAAAAWTSVVAGRLAVDRLRVRGRWVSVADVGEGARLGRDTADIVVARSEARAALDALEAVPNRQAAVLWAREVEGLSYDEIAERHGLTEPTVRSLLHRGRKALRREFAQRGGTVPVGGVVVVALSPALDALRALGRLRRSAVATTAAVTAGLGVVAALVLSPPVGLPVSDLPALAPVVHQQVPPAPGSAVPQDTSAPAPSAAEPAVPSAAEPAVPAAAPVPDPLSAPGGASPSGDALDVLPTGCVGGPLAAACTERPEEVPDGGLTLSAPLPAVGGVPSEVSVGPLEDCPPATTTLCRPSDTAPSPQQPSDVPAPRPAELEIPR